MAEQNVTEYSRVDHVLSELVDDVKKRVDEIQDDPESLVRLIESALCRLDRRVIDDWALRRLITDSYTVAVKQGPYGWIDDTLALRRPWGFSFTDIAAPVCLWHGREDAFSPPSHTEWLAKQIPHADIRVAPDAGHFAAVEILPETLAWLTDPYGSEPPISPDVVSHMRASVAG